MHLLGFRFAPRIRDLGDTKLYIPKGDATYDAQTDDRRRSTSSTSAPIGMKSCGWPPRSSRAR
jgi:TnpA family transposase